MKENTKWKFVINKRKLIPIVFGSIVAIASGVSGASVTNKKNINIQAKNKAKQIIEKLKYPQKNEEFKEEQLFNEICSNKKNALDEIKKSQSVKDIQKLVVSSLEGIEVIKINQAIKNYNDAIYNNKYKIVATNDDNTDEKHFQSIYNEDDQKNVIISKKVNKKEQVNLLRNLNLDKESIFKVDIDEIKKPLDQKDGALAFKDLQDRNKDKNFKAYRSTYVIWKNDTKNGDIAREFNLKNSHGRYIYAQLKWVQNEDKTWNLQLVYDKQEGGDGEDDLIYRYKTQSIKTFDDAQAFINNIQIPNENNEFNEQKLFKKISTINETFQKVIKESKKSNNIIPLFQEIKKINQAIKNYNDAIYNHKYKIVATNDNNTYMKHFKPIYNEDDRKNVIVSKDWLVKEQVNLLRNLKLDNKRTFKVYVDKMKDYEIYKKSQIYQLNDLKKWTKDEYFERNDTFYLTLDKDITRMHMKEKFATFQIKNGSNHKIKGELKWIKNHDYTWNLQLVYYKKEKGDGEDDSIYRYKIEELDLSNINNLTYNQKSKIIFTNDNNVDNFNKFYNGPYQEINLNEKDFKYVIISKKWNDKVQVDLLKDIKLDENKTNYFNVNIKKIRDNISPITKPVVLSYFWYNIIPQENIENAKNIFIKWDPSYKNNPPVTVYKDSIKNAIGNNIDLAIKWFKRKNDKWSLTLEYNKFEDDEGEDDSIYIYNAKHIITLDNLSNFITNIQIPTENKAFNEQKLFDKIIKAKNEARNIINNAKENEDIPTFIEVVNNINQAIKNYNDAIYNHKYKVVATNDDNTDKNHFKSIYNEDDPKNVIVSKKLNTQKQINLLKNVKFNKEEQESIFKVDIDRIKKTIDNTNANFTLKDLQDRTKDENFQTYSSIYAIWTKDTKNGDIAKEFNLKNSSKRDIHAQLKWVLNIDKTWNLQLVYNNQENGKGEDDSIYRYKAQNIETFYNAQEIKNYNDNTYNHKYKIVATNDDNNDEKHFQSIYNEDDRKNVIVSKKVNKKEQVNLLRNLNLDKESIFKVDIDKIKSPYDKQDHYFQIRVLKGRTKDKNFKAYSSTYAIWTKDTKNGDIAKEFNLKNSSNRDIHAQLKWVQNKDKTWNLQLVYDEQENGQGEDDSIYRYKAQSIITFDDAKDFTDKIQIPNENNEFNEQKLFKKISTINETFQKIIKESKKSNNIIPLFQEIKKINQAIKNYNDAIYNHKYKIFATNDDNTDEKHFKSIYNEDNQKNVMVSKKLNIQKQINLLKNVKFNKEEQESIFKVDIDRIKKPLDQKGSAFTLKDLQDRTKDENFQTYSSIYAIWTKDTKNGDIAKEFNLKNSSKRDIHAQLKWVLNIDKTWNLQLVYNNQENGKGEGDSIYRYKTKPIKTFDDAQAFINNIQIPNENNEFNEQELFKKIIEAKNYAQNIINNAKENEDIPTFIKVVNNMNQAIKNYNDAIYNLKYKVVATNDDNTDKNHFKSIYNEDDQKNVIVAKKLNIQKQINLLKNVKFNKEEQENIFKVGIDKIKKPLDQKGSAFILEDLQDRTKDENFETYSSTYAIWTKDTENGDVAKEFNLKNSHDRYIYAQLKWVQNEDKTWNLQLVYDKQEGGEGEDDSIYRYKVELQILNDNEKSKIIATDIIEKIVPTENKEFPHLYQNILKAKKAALNSIKNVLPIDKIREFISSPTNSTIVKEIIEEAKNYEDAIYNHKYKVVATNDDNTDKNNFESIYNEDDRKNVIVSKKWSAKEQVNLLRNLKLDNKRIFKVYVDKMKNYKVYKKSRIYQLNDLKKWTKYKYFNKANFYLTLDKDITRIHMKDRGIKLKNGSNHNIHARFKWIKNSDDTWNLKLFYDKKEEDSINEDDSIYRYKIEEFDLSNVKNLSYNQKSKIIFTNDDNRGLYQEINLNDKDLKYAIVSKKFGAKEQVDLLKDIQLNENKTSYFNVNIKKIRNELSLVTHPTTLNDIWKKIIPQETIEDHSIFLSGIEDAKNIFIKWEPSYKNNTSIVVYKDSIKNAIGNNIDLAIKWVKRTNHKWSLALEYNKFENHKGEDDSIYIYDVQPIITFDKAKAFVKNIHIPTKNNEFNEQELFNKITRAKEEAQKIINQAKENEDITPLMQVIYKINQAIKDYNLSIYNHKSKVVATNDNNNSFKKIIFDETNPKYVIVLKKWRESEQVDLLKNVKLNENKINYFSLKIKKVKNKIVEYSYPDGKNIVSNNPFTASYIKKRIISQDNMEAQENTLIKWDPSYRTKKSVVVYINNIKNVAGLDIKSEMKWVKNQNGSWSLKLEYFKLFYTEHNLEDDSIYIYDVQPIITFDKAKAFVKNIQIPNENKEFNQHELFNKITRAKEEAQKIINQAKENEDITPLMQVIYKINQAIKDYNDVIYNHKYKVVTTNHKGKTHFEEINNESDPKYVIFSKKWRVLEQVDLLKNVKFDQNFAYFKIDIQKIKNNNIIENNKFFALNNILNMIKSKNIENIKPIFVKWDPSYKNIDFIKLYDEGGAEITRSIIKRRIRWVKTSNKSWSLKLYYSPPYIPPKQKDDSIYIYKISKINESDLPNFLNDDTYNQKIKIVATTDDSSHIPFNILGEINTHGKMQNKYVISLKEWGKREQIDLLRNLTFSKNESRYFSINIKKASDEEAKIRRIWDSEINFYFYKTTALRYPIEDLKTIFIKWDPSYKNKKSIIVYTDSIKSAAKHNIKLLIKWVKVGIDKYSLILEYFYFDQNGGDGDGKDTSVYIYDAKENESANENQIKKVNINKKIVEFNVEINKITSQIKLIKGAKEPKDQKNTFEKAIKFAKKKINTIEHEVNIEFTLNILKKLVKKARDEYENAIKVANENKKAADLKVAQDRAKKLINDLAYPKQDDIRHDASLLAKIEEAKQAALIAIKNAKTLEEVNAIVSSPTVGTKLKKVKNAIDDYNKSTAKDKDSVKTKKAKKNKTTIIIVSTLSSIGGLALILGIAYWVRKSKINNLKKK